ncbi:MAG: TonB family protein [Lewinellaceae bacterium]|nr:TonB family protein [Lewinellaceae bacterium]
MKRSLLLCLLSVLSISSTFAQKPKKYYADQVGKDEKMLFADYQSILIKTADGVFVQKIYYPEKKQITHLLTFKDDKFKILDGPYKEWYDNGTPWKEGAFLNGKKEGIWSFYSFETGKKEETGAYLNNERSGRWARLDSTGMVKEEMEFKAGVLNGPNKIYNRAGQLAIVRTYENGEMTGEEKLDTGNPIDTMKMVEVIPYMAGCENDDPDAQKQCSDRKMLESIYLQIRYPRTARENGLEGSAVLRFVVEKDGSITGVTALRGICRDIEAECKRVIGLMPQWAPGRQNGEPVRVVFNLPIKFKLE